MEPQVNVHKVENVKDCNIDRPFSEIVAENVESRIANINYTFSVT